MDAIYLAGDPSYDWEAGGTLEVVADDKRGSWLFAALKRQGSGREQVLVWEGDRWRALGTSAPLFQLYQNRAEELLNGQSWRVKRSEINGTPPRRLWRRWSLTGDDQSAEVTINTNHLLYLGVFDFQCVNDLAFFGQSVARTFRCLALQKAMDSRAVRAVARC
ncbi:MAG: hypothetical protein NZ899_01575 [Thermoguttaceae bacterium]|nr:hypothetical protein [Thermoguttaceae bacterium]MDW8078624.1 hypothetical protein [Thermoguttaceae bacterium]